MLVGMLFYSFFTFVNLKNVSPFFADSTGDLHYLHGYFISFLSAIVVMLIIGKIKPKSDEDIAISDQRDPAPVNMTPWPKAKQASVAIMSTTLGIYMLLTLAAQ